MGFAQGGTSHPGGDSIAIAGVKPTGMAAAGQTFWRAAQAPQPQWQIIGSSSSGVSASATPAFDTTGANLIVLLGLVWQSSVMSDSMGNAWSDGTIFVDTVQGGGIAIRYCSNPATSTAHTFSISGYQNLQAIAFQLQNGTPVLDQTGSYGEIGYGDSNLTFQMPALTPTGSPSLFVTGSCLSSIPPDPYIAQIDSGFTVQEAYWATTTGWGQASAYAFKTGLSPVAPTWTLPETYAFFAMTSFKAG